MEPVAPGTEDEVQVTFPVFSKKEKEQERLLSIKAVLPNGQYANVFELSYVNGSEHWYCNLCECPVMGRVYYHENGNRHNNSVSNSKKRGGRTPMQVDVPTVHVAPGEPVPPGFEKEIEKPTLIQERLDAFTVSPLIGLEYLLEIQEYDREKEPSYLCMLCDKRGDPRTVLAHLVSYNHITQYMQRHFVKVYRALAPYFTKQYKKNWQDMVNKIAEAIELRYGRLKPHPVEKEGFEERKAEYWQMIFNGPHFSDKNGITFEELVVREELTKVNEEPSALNIQKPSEDVAKRSYRRTGSVPGAGEPPKKRSPSPPVVAKPVKKAKPAAPLANRRSLSSVSSISSSDLSDYEPEKKKVGRKASPPRYRSRSRSPYKKSKLQRRSPSPRNMYRDKPGVLPWQRPDYIKSRNDMVPDRNKTKTDKFEEYRKLANAIENDMEKTLKQHKKNPEKHAQYNDEWKKFWNKRYKELQGEGKDAANHDFKPEWIVFWNKRMIELHQTEMKAKKDALRKRLGLPEEPAPICFRITGKKKPNGNSELKPNKPAPMASEPDQDHEVIVIEDKDDDTLSSKRSHSPWESEPTRPSSRVSREKSRERSYERRSRERSYERRSDYKYRSPERRYNRRGKSRDLDYRSYLREKSWEREREPYRDYRRDIPDCYKPPPVMRDVTRQPVFTPTGTTELEPEDDDTGNINVVAVLRLLTALEEKLGSLGPKIIDMLGQALALEKNEANSSESLLENDINCVLFETVKEKLKGQLLAGLVDYTQEKAFKNAIKKIASLMHFANELKTRKQKEKRKVDPVKVPGIGTVDKAAIAKQIATALISQGKTDVTQDELEELINAVVGMAEASKTSGKLITTAGFIEKFNISQKASPKKGNKSSQEEFLIKLGTPPHSAGPSNDNSTSMEGLSDSDLQTLLQNFKDLSTDEQHGLITYLKKLEAREPERVERLRKFVNLGSGQSAEKSSRLSSPSEGGREHLRISSPFSIRLAGTNPTVEENNFKLDDDDEEKEEAPPSPKREPPKIKIDSDDEDYSYEDVFKVAKQKVTEKEMEKERQLVEDTIRREPKNQVDLSDAKALIANIMENINRKDTASNLLGLQIPKANARTTEGITPVSAASIVSALGTFPVNVSNLADIVGNIHTMEQRNLSHVNAQKTPESPKSTFPPHILPQNRTTNQNFYQGQNASPLFPQNPRSSSFPSQNVQYPLKNQYGNYPQNTGYPNQGTGGAYPNQDGGYGRGGPPQNSPYNRFGGTPDVNNRGGGNTFNNGQGGNYGGNHW